MRCLIFALCLFSQLVSAYTGEGNFRSATGQYRAWSMAELWVRMWTDSGSGGPGTCVMQENATSFHAYESGGRYTIKHPIVSSVNPCQNGNNSTLTNWSTNQYEETCASSSGQPNGTVYNVATHTCVVDTCPSGTVWNPATSTCDAIPEPTECSAVSGTDVYYESDAEGEVCVNSCEVVAFNRRQQLDGIYINEAVYTGATCSGGVASAEPDSEGAICVTSGTNTYCLNENLPKNCGTINDVGVCLESPPPGGCTFIAGGSFVCDATAPDTAKPDNGTPGQTVEPLATITSDSGTQTEIYTPAQVAGSSTTINNISGTGGSYGNTDSATEGTLQDILRELQNDDDIQETAPFAGTAPGELYTATTATYGSVIEDFQTDIEAAPFYAAATEFFDVTLSGACPVWTIPATWVFPAIAIDMQCSAVMEDIWPFIYAVMLLSASFVAFRWAFL